MKGDRYHQLRELGQGGFGRVWLVEDRYRPGTRLALKELTEAGATGLEQLRLEFATLTQLRHPNLVEVYDLEPAPGAGGARFTMEYVEGRDLVSAVQSAGPPLLLPLAAESLRALAFLHDFDLIHRDLKPANLMVRDKPRLDCRLVVLDFGLAMRGAREGEVPGVKSSAAGTLQYLAPEIFEGQPFSPRSDLYALGAVLFQAVHGRPPFELSGGNVVGFIDMVREGRRARPPLPEGYSTGLRDWLESLLVPDPTKRPGSAPDALARLNAACGTHFPDDTPDGRSARLASGSPPGREREIESLWKCLEPSDQPRVVWLTGRRGMGKRRLTRWLAGDALARGWEVSSPPPGLPQGGQLLEDLRARAVERPTLVVLEQVDSAGGRVLDFLERVAQEGKAPPLRVVASLDPGEVRQPRLRKLLERTGEVPTLRRVELEPLGSAGVRALILRGTGGRGVSKASVDWLHRASEGNPLLAEMLLTEGAWSKGKRATKGFTLDQSIAARLERLSEAGVAWLEALAVVGIEASDALLASVANLDPWTELEAAAEMSAAGLARRGATGWVIASRTQGEQVLSRAGVARRRKLCRRAAELVPRHDEAAQADPSLLARLWSGADEPERAAQYATRAAESAEEQGDPAAAGDCFAFALRHLGKADPRRLELRLKQAAALREANLLQEAARAYGAAARFARDSDLRGDILSREAEMLVQAGRFERARVVAGQALDLARDGAPRSVAARAKKAIGIALSRLGDAAGALQHLTEALDGFGQTADRAHAVQALAICEANEGLAEARGHFEEAVELFRELGQEGKGLISGVGLGVIEQRAGRYETSNEIYERTRRVAAKHHNLLMEGIVNHYLARNAVQQDRLDTALELSDEGTDQGVYLGDMRLRDSCRTIRAQVLTRCGRGAEAVALLESTLEEPLARVDPLVIGEMRMALAEALMASGSPDEARIRELLLECRKQARRWNDPETLLWSLTAELERRARESVDEPLDPIRSEFDEAVQRGGFWVQPFYAARADLAGATALLAAGQLERALHLARSAANQARVADLPARESQAMALIAEALQGQGESGEAEQALDRGRELLRRAAARIEQPDLRNGFLENPAFRRLAHEESSAASIGERRLLALYDMIRALNSETDPDELLESILDMAIEVVAAERGMILLHDPASDSFSVSLARNLEKETIEDAETFSRRIVKEAGAGKSILAIDALHDERFRELKSISLFEICSLMCVPLRSRGTIVGTVYLDDRREGRLFTRDDLRFLEAFADHAALALENVRARAQLLAENQRLRAAAEARVQFDNLVGRCSAMQSVFDLIEKVAARDLSVLILGETGTGKELVARAIHFHSPRRKAGFVSENCAALPESLLQSELFGHVRGAFTGAERDHAGLFEQADGGTLFLDEIGDMSPAMQAQLLRVLQDGEVRRVGGDRPIQVDVRTVVATHRDLEQRVAEGRFREDLLYRVQQLVIQLPPLRERAGDLPLLAEHFLRQIAEEIGRPPTRMTRRAQAMLEEHAWPGNVRQLQNTIRRLSVLAGDAPITPNLLARDPTFGRGARVTVERAEPELSLELQQREQIRRALERADNNRTRAARMLGISRATIYRKIREYGL